MGFDKIFTDGNLVEVHVSMWTGAKHLQPEDLGLTEKDVSEAFQLGKKKLVPAEVTAELKHLDYMARRALALHSLPFPFGSARFVPKKRFVEFAEKFNKIKAEFVKKADDLAENYMTYKVKMRKEYTKAANRAYERLSKGKGFHKSKDVYIRSFLARINKFYPPADEIRKRYSMDYVVFQMSLPDLTQASYEDLAEEHEKIKLMRDAYRQSLEDRIEEFVDDFINQPRQGLVAAFNRLKRGLEGKSKITGSTIRCVNRAIEDYQKMDMSDDKKLPKILVEFKTRCLDRIDAAALRDSIKLQGAVKDELAIVMPIVSDQATINELKRRYRERVGL